MSAHTLPKWSRKEFALGVSVERRPQLLRVSKRGIKLIPPRKPRIYWPCYCGGMTAKETDRFIATLERAVRFAIKAQAERISDENAT